MPSELLIPKDKFRSDIALRIAEGRAILDQYDAVNAPDESFRKLYRAYEQWSNYNQSWLEHIFSGERNSHEVGYENAGGWNLERMSAARYTDPDDIVFKYKYFDTYAIPKVEFLEDLQAKIDFLPVRQQDVKPSEEHNSMNNDEIIKTQAHNAVTTAERYGIHNHRGQYIEALREQSLKLYQPEAKATYFEEAIRLVKEKVAAHRATCKEGPGCPTEKKYEEAIFFLQQELDILPKPATAPTRVATPVPAPSNEAEKIFISHASKDAAIVEEVIDLLEVAGIEPSQIFCSSFEGYSIGLGQDFLQRIKEELNGNVLVLFILTPNFYNSPVSLCEMGAAWVKTSKHIPVVVPPLSYEDVKGVIPLTQGFRINEPMKWNTLKQQLEQWFNILHKTPPNVWERKRDKAIQNLNQKIAQATPQPQTPEPPKSTPSSEIIFGGISL